MTAHQESESSPSTTTSTPTSSLASLRHIRSQGLFIEWAVECSVLATAQASHAAGIRRVCIRAADLLGEKLSPERLTAAACLC